MLRASIPRAIGIRTMPLYEYYCRSCARKFSKLRSITTAGETTECEMGHIANPMITVGVQMNGASEIDEQNEIGQSGGCGCGRGGCGCGALN